MDFMEELGRIQDDLDKLNIYTEFIAYDRSGDIRIEDLSIAFPLNISFSVDSENVFICVETGVIGLEIEGTFVVQPYGFDVLGETMTAIRSHIEKIKSIFDNELHRLGTICNS
jgi:hypothetical protein